ncbi:MAG: flagellar hook-length control protein FliK [Lachnospiraceae bacterium]|nr:flagellar hook-length control protein FliK [Lachnospiraceae bacterium]
MTSTPVNGLLNQAKLDFLSQTPNGGKVQGSDFKDYLNFSKGQSDAGSKPIAQKPDNNLKVNEKPEIKETYKDKPTVMRTENVKTENPQKDVLDEDVKAVCDAIEDVKAYLEEELNVTEEEIVNVLETLQLTMAALLNPEKLPEIVAKLSDCEDTLTLATDENLYETLTDLTGEVENILEDISKDLGIDKEELKENIKDFSSVLNTKEVEEPINEEKAPVADVIGKTFEEKITVRNFKENEGLTRDLEAVSKEEASIDPSRISLDRRETEGFHKNSHEETNHQAFNFTQNLLSKAVEALNEQAPVQSFTTVSAENVLNQITEAIKIDITADASEISLQLTPENLGTVKVKVSSNNEGVLTAQFTAQNESVKAVIESQAIVLKETLESKGVTVEAIEVTVQSHEFERNLSDQNRGNTSDNNQPKKRGIRRINLSAPEEEIATSEDALLKEIMTQNGNTVDYSA